MEMRDLYKIQRMSPQSLLPDYGFLAPYASVGGKGPLGDWLIFSFGEPVPTSWIAVIAQPEGGLSFLGWGHYRKQAGQPTVQVMAVHTPSERDVNSCVLTMEALLSRLAS